MEAETFGDSNSFFLCASKNNTKLTNQSQFSLLLVYYFFFILLSHSLPKYFYIKLFYWRQVTTENGTLPTYQARNHDNLWRFSPPEVLRKVIAWSCVFSNFSPWFIFENSYDCLSKNKAIWKYIEENWFYRNYFEYIESNYFF